MEIQNVLPQSTFVPFRARRLKDASVAYVNLSLFQEYNYFNNFLTEDDALYQAVLDQFAFIVPVTEDDYALVNSDEREFLAERYGGVGILANGGGARCGLAGPFQVKGIGPTPVAGEGVSFWYSHGGMALQDALTELLYSHAASIALPYQSSRVLAVIDTNGYVLQRAYKNRVNEDEDERHLVRRALIVRESRIRPAHFARAFYFKPSKYVKENFPHDHQRVADAIPLLPGLVGSHAAELNKGQNFFNAIEQIISRAAIQLSYSKVRRLMHGSLTLSNFLIDGGWVDFGSVTAVPAYGQLITASQQPPFWDEFNLFQKASADLCFYVGKFQPDVKSAVGDGAEIYQRFVDLYIKQLRVLFVELTGFPLTFARHFLNNPNYDRLGAILLHVARYEDPKPHISEWVLQCEVPAYRWKNQSLRTVLQKLFHAYWIVGDDRAPELAFKSQLVRDLWEAYKAVCFSIEEASKSQGITREALVQFIGLNMVRQMIGVKPLYRGQVLASIRQTHESVVSHSELRHNVNKMFSEYNALCQLHYSVPFNTDLLIAINADSVRLLWDSAASQYRLEIPEKVARHLCRVNAVDSLQLMVGNELLSFNFQSGESNYFSVRFGGAGAGFLHDLKNIKVVCDESLYLMNLFPHSDELYISYKAAFDGLEPPAEEPQH